MNRREALSSFAIMGGLSLTLSSGVFMACHTPTYEARFFLQEELPLLDEIGETILPETADSPGAKAAFVGNCIDTLVADCYPEKSQKIIQTGLAAFQGRCQKEYGESFLDLLAANRHSYLLALDTEAKEHVGKAPHYFSLLKSLVLFSYFSSQEGASQALHYLPIPGRYQGNIPLKPGEKAWAL